MLPKELAHAQETALDFVHQHPHHDLNPGYRTAIFEQMGTLLTFDQMDSPTADIRGYTRRVTLALGVTHKILPVWIASRSTNPEPQAWLQRAQDVFYRTVTHERTMQETHELGRDIGDFASYMEEVVLRAWGDPLIGFGYAALTTLSTAFSDENCLPVRSEADENGDEDYRPIHDLSVPESDVYYQCRDTAAWAAMVAADGLAGWPKSSAEKRLSYWDWWLTEAVPSAWGTVSDQLGRIE